MKPPYNIVEDIYKNQNRNDNEINNLPKKIKKIIAKQLSNAPEEFRNSIEAIEKLEFDKTVLEYFFNQHV